MKWLFLVLFPISLFAKVQVWNTDGLHLRLSRNVYFTGETEFRYGQHKTQLYYKHYQGGLLLFRSPHTLFQLGYRQVYHRFNKNWEKEYSPLFDIFFQVANRRGLHISDRNRLQYRIFSHFPNRWLYRNRLEFVPPFRLFRSYAPFLAYELFWQEASGINENRLEAGFKIPYHKRTQLNLIYMYRTVKDFEKKWSHQNVIWIYFSLHF